MSAFGGLILTNKGKALQAKAQLGAELNYTRIAVGDGALGGSSIVDLTALKNQVKSLDITKLKTLPDGKAVVGGVLTNSGLLTGFYWREIGVFATDPDDGEILYCYGNSGSNAEYIPADGGPDIVEKSVDVITIIGNASSVTATIEQSLVYATQQDLGDLEDKLSTLYATTNAGNVYSFDASITAYVDGQTFRVKINANSTGNASFNVSGKGAVNVLEANGTNVTNLKANGVYTVVYSGGNFILQGEGGSGNATASDLILNKTASTDAGDIVGEIIDRGTVNITPSTSNQTIAAGKHSGLGVVYGDADLVTGNIKAGANVFGVPGKTEVIDTTKAANPITAATTLTPLEGFVNGNLVIGTMPNNTNLELDSTITGYMYGGYAYLRPPTGFWDHNGISRVKSPQPHCVEANIRIGKSIFGIAGTLIPGDIVTLGETLWASSDAQVDGGGSSSHIKCKEIRVSKAGTIRVRFDMASSNSTLNLRIAYGYIAINGVQVSSMFSNGDDLFSTFTYDATVNANDLIQIYSTSDGGWSSRVKNFRLYTATSYPIATILM